MYRMDHSSRTLIVRQHQQELRQAAADAKLARVVPDTAAAPQRDRFVVRPSLVSQVRLRLLRFGGGPVGEPKPARG